MQPGCKGGEGRKTKRKEKLSNWMEDGSYQLNSRILSRVQLQSNRTSQAAGRAPLRFDNNDELEA